MKRFLFKLVPILVILGLLTAGCIFGEIVPERQTQTIGGTLNLYGIDPLTLDPAVAGELTSHEYIVQIYGGLLAFDDNLQSRPNIAQSWQLSGDGRTYTFSLRRDVKFHNGKGVTAADFKYSWERAATPSTKSQTAASYLGDIVGIKEMLTGRATAASGITVVDDYTLQVTIDSPKTYFLSKLTYPTSYVVDRESVRGNNWWRQPNGTGPFKLKRWEQNKELVLERNDLFYGEKAKLDSVVFGLYSGNPMDLYEMGKIDATGTSGSFIYRVTDPASHFSRELTVVPELAFFYAGFNAAKPPFDDANIRRAFSMAVDKDKLAALVFHGTVQRADGILPPGMPGYNKNVSGLRYDVAEAKRLIAASKYGDVSKLPTITITTSGYGGSLGNDVEALVYQWRQNLGVDIKVRQLEPEVFLYKLPEELDNMYVSGWVADYPHPQDFLDILFHTDSEINYGRYSNREVDALLDSANAEVRSEQSMKLYQDAEQKLVSDAAAFPLWFGKSHTLSKPYVKGYKPNPLGIVMLNRVSVEPH